MVADLRPGSSGSAPNPGCGIGGVFFFIADDGVSGRELWRTDGTVAGTVPVADIWAGPQGSTPESMLCLSG
jgi:ELWxxDGT repeat protein